MKLSPRNTASALRADQTYLFASDTSIVSESLLIEGMRISHSVRRTEIEAIYLVMCHINLLQSTRICTIIGSIYFI